jgi:hypothetical protein
VDTAPRPPAGLGVSGRRLWRAIVRDYEPASHELELLRQACRVLDTIDALDEVTETDGVVVDSPQGRKAAPSVVEGRAQRLAFAKMLAALGVDDADVAAGAGPGAASRPPAGSAPSGLYAVPGSS